MLGYVSAITEITSSGIFHNPTGSLMNVLGSWWALCGSSMQVRGVSSAAVNPGFAQVCQPSLRNLGNCSIDSQQLL